MNINERQQATSNMLRWCKRGIRNGAWELTYTYLLTDNAEQSEKIPRSESR